MTHDQFQEMHFLKVLFDRTQSKELNYHQEEIITEGGKGVMNNEKARDLFFLFKTKGYIDEIDHPKPVHQGTKLYIISDAGKLYLHSLKNEFDKEQLDIRIKEQTVSGTRFSRNIAYASLFVAGVTAFVPFFIWFIDRGKIQKTKTEMPQLEQVIQSQEQLQQTVQDLQRTIQSLDTTVKRVRILKK